MTPARFIACGFGSGLAPVAAGTFGTLAALLVGVPLLEWSRAALAVAALAATLGGLWAVAHADALDDPGWVVIDEFAGMWITMLALPRPSLRGLAIAFVLFRLADITKLGPVGWADRQKNAVGVMGDDVIAGVASALLLAGAAWLWPGLLG